jgi:ABC-type transporter Mla MlaB component
MGASAPKAVFVDVHGVKPDALTVDALARLQLAARRRGLEIKLRGPSDQLLELIAFMGLTEVLPD